MQDCCFRVPKETKQGRCFNLIRGQRLHPSHPGCSRCFSLVKLPTISTQQNKHWMNPNGIVEMPDGQNVPVYWRPDSNTLEMLRVLDTKGAEHAVTTRLALGVLRLIFGGYKLKNPEEPSLKIKPNNINKNVKKQIRRLKTETLKTSTVSKVSSQHPWLACLNPVVSVRGQRNENVQNAMHSDLTNESVQASDLRTALSVHPLLLEVFRSLGYQIDIPLVKGWSDDSSTDSTHRLDFEISGGGGGSGSLSYASMHQTVMERCSTSDVKRLQVRSEELTQPFLRLSDFYEAHNLPLVDVHDLVSGSKFQQNSRVSLINFVCVLLKTSSNLFEQSVFLDITLEKTGHSFAWCPWSHVRGSSET